MRSNMFGCLARGSERRYDATTITVSPTATAHATATAAAATGQKDA